MNASRTSWEPSSGLPADAEDQAGPKAALALSVGLGNFKFELNIGRSLMTSFRQAEVRESLLRHLRFTDDDRERARESRFRALRSKRARGYAQAPLETGPSPNGSGGIPDPPPHVGRGADDGVSPRNFWFALSPAQQQEFRLLAEERTFAAGAPFMQEGDRADYVIVILDGRTKISVQGSNGIERVVAHRGPGQLVGERAALRVNVRSATVVALEQVQALVMTTPNFAAFLTAHPDVLKLVEAQVYERLTETTSRNEAPSFTSAPVANYSTMSLARSGLGATMENAEYRYPQLDGQNCTIIFSDVVAFGSPSRSDKQRRIIRQEVLDMTRASLGAIWSQCHHEDRGDGLLVVAPPEIPTVQILEYLLIALPIALKRHNSTYADGAQIQLRVAVDVGPVTGDELGVSGQVIINAARLLEAQAFKEAMSAKRAQLGVIVSDFVFHSAVSQADYLTDPTSYTELDVQVKQTSLRARMLLVETPIGMGRPIALAASS